MTERLTRCVDVRFNHLGDLSLNLLLRLLICHSGPPLVRHLRRLNWRPLVLGFFLSALAVTAQEWTRFHGPNGSGISGRTNSTSAGY